MVGKEAPMRNQRGRTGRLAARLVLRAWQPPRPTRSRRRIRTRRHRACRRV